LHEITIHPNPVIGNFIVGNMPTTGDFGISIYSSAGQMIKAQKLQSGSNVVQFPPFNGVAVVIITDSNGNIVKEEKLVSKRDIH
jgi:hypothetical protein